MAGRLPEPSAIGPPYPVLTPAVSSRVRPAMHGKRLLGWMVGTQCGLGRKTTGCNFCWSVLLASGCIFHLALWGLLLKVSPTMCQALHCPLDEVASVKPPGSSPNLGLLSSVAHPAPMPFVPAWLLWAPGVVTLLLELGSLSLRRSFVSPLALTFRLLLAEERPPGASPLQAHHPSSSLSSSGSSALFLSRPS